MAESSRIEWTDATFNPWQGCTKVSPGCDNCYAEARQDTRLHAVKWGAGQPRKRTTAAYWREPEKWNAREFFQCTRCGWRGDDLGGEGFHRCPRCVGETLQLARRRVFCASLADVFDNEVDPQWRADLFALILRTPNLDWLLLTKRIGNALPMLDEIRHPADPDLSLLELMPLPNVWLGATIVNQEEADRDIPKLLATPARVRFLSMEPLLGPVDLPGFNAETSWCPICKAIVRDGLLAAHENQHGPGLIDQPFDPAVHCSSVYDLVNWVIVGGESGPKARPMNPEWARSLRDQCKATGVPFLFKQWGEWLGAKQDGAFEHDPLELNASDVSVRVGKKAAGRALDGVTHSAFPVAR
jgi:protein gp37